MLELTPPARILRGCSEAVLRAGDRFLPVRFVLDRPWADLLLPAPREVLDADDHAAHVPDEADDALQLLVEPEPIDPGSHAGADRWMACHGRAREPVWLLLRITGARVGSEVFDRDDVVGPGVPPEFATVEHAVIARLNGAPDTLREACRRATGTGPETPRCVGVDPWGLDVRAHLGIIRVEFGAPCRTPADVYRSLGVDP